MITCRQLRAAISRYYGQVDPVAFWTAVAERKPGYPAREDDPPRGDERRRGVQAIKGSRAPRGARR
jgi:hypothetical protein